MKSLSKGFIRRKDPTRRARIEELRLEQMKEASGGRVVEGSVKDLKERYYNTMQVACAARSRR